DKNLKIGDRYSIGDLMFAALLESSNESAEAIASFVGRKEFIALMNKQVASWGFADTHFDDPTGLSASNQSTAVDLLGLSKQIYEKYPEIFKITQRPSGYITELNSNKKLLIKSINLFAGQDNFLGGKTGFIDEAGGNLLSIFSYRTRPIIIIVLDTGDRFGDTEKLLNWFMATYK
ncbi:MAG: hypothetical protein Q7K44_00200, partial [Candidatus Liptonbacteria bacterium]|nr:hypothetical protein [Candidatus Liptonbacteria bacterium]